jgi:stearoyl-CoA desaturase (delta-9 desaturase)
MALVADYSISRKFRIQFLFFILVHVACFAAIWTGVSGGDIALMMALYWLRMFGVTAGYHRYFSHRAYRTSRVFQFVLAFIAQSSLQSGVVWWAAKHRAHHRYSDAPEDSHSPVQHGFWFSHVGWIFNEAGAKADYERVPDLTRYPELMWLDRNSFLPGIVLGLATWALFGWSGLVVGFFWSTVLLYHSTFAINSLAHVLGKPRYLTGDASKNNFWLALVTMGEGWHNNHHYYMASARQGFRWYEVDGSYYLLRLLAVFGLVWEIKEPPAHILQQPRKLSDDLIERIAKRIADAFCAEAISLKVRERLHALHEAPSIAELVRAELPSIEEMQKKASRMFARTEALTEIVHRAQAVLAQAVNQRLANNFS